MNKTTDTVAVALNVASRHDLKSAIQARERNSGWGKETEKYQIK